MPGRPENILKSVSQIASALFQSSSWEESIQNVLRWLGEATEVSRVYLLEYGQEKGVSTVFRGYEWAAPGVSPQFSHAEIQQLPWVKYGAEHWCETLVNRQAGVSNLQDFPPEARSCFVEQGIQSLIAAPIHIHQRFWGVLVFDSGVQDREWMLNEFEALKAVANMLGGAIARQRVEEALLQAHMTDVAQDVPAEQRVALVREVHHRVKNNLQGIIGLLRQQLGGYPDLQGPMEGAIGQISSIAVVYGLQGKKDPENVYLCEIVKAVADQAQAIGSKSVEICLALQIEHPLRMRSEEAIPLALIVNELVSNAVKHSTGNGSIGIDFSTIGGRGVLNVTNTFEADSGCLDFERGIGLGTGLELVRSLMPKSGAKLDIKVVENEVLARFEVYPPVVQVALGVECTLALEEFEGAYNCSGCKDVESIRT